MTTKLMLGPGIDLPAQAVTETFGLLAVRGAGKTNAARVMAEEMFEARLPFVAIDPVGSWWGLRSSRDGKSPGLPIPIFGGKHGDVPLERTGGALMADLVVDQSLCCVVDVSGFESEAARKGFLLDFARRLYQRNEHPLHLFLEEADDYIPQRPMRDEAQLLRAWENLVRRGRSRGIGLTLITQRSAVLNKNVLEQVQNLIALRTTGPRDRDSIADWLKYHAQAKEALESLPSLADGEAWIWSPNFLKRMDRVRFRLSETFDSGETPKVGKQRTAATLADVDLDSVRTRMAATIERAKADDPRELRRRIAELEAKAREKAPAKVERVEVRVPDLVAVEALKVLSNDLRETATQVQECARLVANACMVRPEPTIRKAAALSAAAVAQEVTAGQIIDSNGELAPVHHRILDGLKELSALGLDSPARVQVAFMAGYGNPRSGGFTKAMGHLSSVGLIRYPDSGSVALTPAGSMKGAGVKVPESADEVQGRFLKVLQPVHRRILEPLIRAYPNAMDRAEVGQIAGYTNPRSGGFTKALGRLSALGLVDYPSAGEARATSLLFMEVP